jgi:hypothetical protein
MQLSKENTLIHSPARYQGRSQVKRLLLRCCLLALAGCQPAEPETAGEGKVAAEVEESGQVGLPWSGQVYGLLADDVNGDGQQDLLGVDHSKGMLQTFLQTAPRQFQVGAAFDGVGFHPGTFFRWPGEPGQYVLGAEGDSAVRSLRYTSAGQFEVLHNLPERVPRYVRHFRWPGWGDSVVVSPYANGYVVLLKDYHPDTGLAKERVVVPLAESPQTIRGAEKVTVADVDGDGIDELLLGINTTNELMVIRHPAKPGKKPEADVLLENNQWGTPNEAQVMDLDADGDNDLLLPDEAPPGKIRVFLNQGRGTFKPGKDIDFPLDGGVTELRIQRDHDGRLIMLAAGYGAIALYRFPEGWQDGQPLERLHIDWPSEIARDLLLQDIDGDGWLDGVLGRKSGKARIWVVYGPLHERFEQLSQHHFELK